MNKNLLELLQQADNFLHKSDYQSAYNIYINLIKDYNNSPEIYNNLSICTSQLKSLNNNFELSINYIKKAIELDPNNPIYLAQYAEIISNIDFELSDKLFKQAISIFNTTQNNQNDTNLIQIKNNYAKALFNQAYRITVNNFKQAIDLFNLSISNTDNNLLKAKSYYNIACCYMNIDNTEQAIDNLNKAVIADPNHSNAHFALSQYYQQINNLKLAEKHLQKSIDSKNYNLALAEYNYGVLEQEKNNYTKAIEHYTKSLKINPKLFASCYNIASIYHKLKDYNNAAIHYQQALNIKPDDQSCKYLLACISENHNAQIKIPEKSPNKYIENLFDSYANNFEQELIEKLDYKTPELLYKLFINNINIKNNYNILDLGCGTGLIGEYFNKISNNIIGIDLSSNMLEIAKKKNIYSNLIKAELEYFLEQNNINKIINNIYLDLIILADVLVYFGDLNNIFNKLSDIKHNKYILFSIELLELEKDSNNNYKLNQTGRYTHNINYIKNLISTYKYNIIEYKQVNLRKQANIPVTGLIFLLERI